MKTLSFSLLLLLLTLCSCNAIRESPGVCCFNFKKSAVPSMRVSSITQTHSSCLKKAFIVHTVRGKQICYSQTFQWAQDLYHLLNTEGSGRTKVI
uniref:Chemokine interleukin-8-like domain-containing protein n=1 Tax=Amphilophus citrinellus TaxID=61819 RepID=A0A3Q0RRS8_AMPCI